jgi:hypothetical protein
MKREQSEFEKWLDNHNHEMEFLRTVCSLLAAIASTMVLLKVFGLI